LRVNLPSSAGSRETELPVLGIARELPGDKEALITEGFFVQIYRAGGLDTLPDYNQISLYIHDLLGDGLPLCDALADLDFAITEGQRGQLAWIVRLISYIRIFAWVASAGLLIVVLGQLTKSFWEAILRKEKQIGVLLAYGIRRGHLRLTFWLEAAIVWFVASVFAVALDGIAVARLIDLAYRNVPNAGRVPPLPPWLWVFIVFGALGIATISVMPALRKVEARRVANMLKAVN
jgi:hypothetical protein